MGILEDLTEKLAEVSVDLVLVNEVAEQLDSLADIAEGVSHIEKVLEDIKWRLDQLEGKGGVKNAP